MATSRRTPEQFRSRERVDAILAAAQDLIAQSGHVRFSMSELAKAAGTSLPSIYRYFADKSALVGALYERYAEASYDRVREALAGANDGLTIHKICENGLRAYFGAVRNDPVHKYLTAAIQADPSLEHADLASARRHAELMTQLLVDHLGDGALAIAASDLALLFTYLAGAASRLSSLVEEPEASRLEQAYINVALSVLTMAGPPK